LQIVDEFLEVELRGKDCLFEHFDAFSLRVETAQLLQSIA